MKGCHNLLYIKQSMMMLSTQILTLFIPFDKNVLIKRRCWGWWESSKHEIVVW